MAIELNVKVEVNKQTVYTEGDSGEFVKGLATFSSMMALAAEGEEFADVPDDLKEQFTRVNLSRLGQNPECNFHLDSLASHDNHAPTFVTVDDMEVYVARVMKDVSDAQEKNEALVADYYSEKEE